MLRSNSRFIEFLRAIADLLIVSAAFWLAYVFRVDRPVVVDDVANIYLLLWAGALPGWYLLLHYYGAYASLRERSPWTAARPVVYATANFTVIQLALLFLAKVPEVSRGVALVYPFVAAGQMIVLRWGGRALLGSVRQGGYNFRNILFVGANDGTLNYAARVMQHLDWGMRIRGVLLTEEGRPADWPAKLPVLGTAADLAAMLTREPIDRVVFSHGGDYQNGLANLLAVCEELGVEAVVVPPSFRQLQVARIHVEEFFGMPVVHYTTTPKQAFQLAFKRVMDFTLTAAALVFLAPLFIALAVAIKLESPGPVFFRQYRSGIRGRRFNCYKFRSMYVDAEARLAELKAHNEMSGPVFKMKDDPRITRVGKFIRKYSLDELPQLFNVFRGDMSLVGPRPPLPAEVDQYEPWQRRRLSMKPGITCIWQVSGRNNIDFDQWMRLDLQYIDNWNLRLDIKLLLQTIPAVIRGTGT